MIRALIQWLRSDWRPVTGMAAHRITVVKRLPGFVVKEEQDKYIDLTTGRTSWVCNGRRWVEHDYE